MRFAWFRWRLLVVCLVAGLVLPVVTVIQVLGRAAKLAGADEVSADYLREATFSPETLATLALWWVEIAVLLYGLSLLVLFIKERRGNRGGA